MLFAVVEAAVCNCHLPKERQLALSMLWRAGRNARDEKIVVHGGTPYCWL